MGGLNFINFALNWTFNTFFWESSCFLSELVSIYWRNVSYQPFLSFFFDVFSRHKCIRVITCAAMYMRPKYQAYIRERAAYRYCIEWRDDICVYDHPFGQVSWSCVTTRALSSLSLSFFCFRDIVRAHTIVCSCAHMTEMRMLCSCAALFYVIRRMCVALLMMSTTTTIRYQKR